VTPNRNLLNRIFSYIFAGAVSIYLLLAAVYFAARALDCDPRGFVSLAANFINFWLLISFLLLVIALVARQWVWAGLLGLPVVAFVVMYGPLFFGRRVMAGSDPQLTVMTFNIAFNRADDALLVESIRESGADVVALQEVDVIRGELVQNELSDIYPYQAVYTYDWGGVIGQAVLSKYPIVSEQVITDPYNSNFQIFLVVSIDVDGEVIQVVGSHTALPNISRAGYYSQMAQSIEILFNQIDTSQTTLILGDFNATDQSDGYEMITEAGFSDAWREAGAGFGFTYPNFGYYDPVGRYYWNQDATVSVPRIVRIDYIFYAEEFFAAKAWLGADIGSDHMPVMANLVWYDEQ